MSDNVVTIKFEVVEWEVRADVISDNSVVTEYWREPLSTNFSNFLNMDVAPVFECPLCHERIPSWGMTPWCAVHLISKHDDQFIENVDDIPEYNLVRYIFMGRLVMTHDRKIVRVVES